MSPLMAGFMLTPSDYIGALITLSILIVLAMTQFPREWQTVTGFFLTLLVGVPVALLAVGALQSPFLAAGAMLALGAYAAAK